MQLMNNFNISGLRIVALRILFFLTNDIHSRLLYAPHNQTSIICSITLLLLFLFHHRISFAFFQQP